jgi:hypothetical protein
VGSVVGKELRARWSKDAEDDMTGICDYSVKIMRVCTKQLNSASSHCLR